MPTQSDPVGPPWRIQKMVCRRPTQETGLNFHGTELVVLSAGKTGLGQVQSGEGVFVQATPALDAGALWNNPGDDVAPVVNGLKQVFGVQDVSVLDPASGASPGLQPGVSHDYSGVACCSM